MGAIGNYEPLARHYGGKALAYSALGATLYLETLTRDDEARLQNAVEQLWKWFGQELKWCIQSFNSVAEPTTLEELEYIPTYSRNFPLSEDRLALASTLDEYSVRSSCGAFSGEPGPFQLEFYGAIDWAEEKTPGVVRSVLGYCVPDDYDLDEFERHARDIARHLRLRWDVAGYRYAYSDAISGYAAADVRWAHARRYRCYDLAEYVGAESMHRLFEELPTVSWLTWLGTDLAGRVAAKLRAVHETNSVKVIEDGGNVLLKAGNRPERGDVNRLEIPEAYVIVDELLREIRLDDGNAVCVPARN